MSWQYDAIKKLNLQYEMVWVGGTKFYQKRLIYFQRAQQFTKINHGRRGDFVNFVWEGEKALKGQIVIDSPSQGYNHLILIPNKHNTSNAAMSST